jgi:hypothetical protein
MSLWVYFTTDVSHVFLAKRDATDYSWEIGRNAGNDQLLVRINSNTNVATGGNLPINTWLHVAGTYDNSTIRAYINGVLVNEVVYSTAISVNATALTLGARALFAGAESFFPLKIDDARIYNRALTPPEIRQLASRRGIGLQSTPRHTDYLETREKTYSVIVRSQQEHSSLSEGLVGAWCPSLGASGYRLIDRSGYGNHGVLTNMTSDDWVVSGGAGALDFDGSDDVGVANPLQIASTNAFSAFCWTNAGASMGTDAQLFAQYNTTDNQRCWQIGTQSTTRNFQVILSRDGTSADIKLYISASNLFDGTWRHVGFTFALNVLRLFVNGRQITVTAQLDATINSLTNFSALTTIGARQAGGSFATHCLASVDDCRVYNRALTEPEIRLLASKRGIGLQPRPKQFTYYQFPSGSKRRRILTGMT